MIYIILPTQIKPEPDTLHADDDVSFHFVGGRIRHYNSYDDAREDAIEMSDQEGIPYSIFKFDTCLEATDHREIFLP